MEMNSIHDFRFFVIPTDVDEVDEYTDAIDMIVPQARLILLRDSENENAIAFLPASQELKSEDEPEVYFNQTRVVIQGVLEKAGFKFDKELIEGLLICADDEDEDGLYDYCEAEGGEVVFGAETDLDTDYPGCLGVICSYATDLSIDVDGKSAKLDDMDQPVNLDNLLGYYDEDETYSVLWTG